MAFFLMALFCLSINASSQAPSFTSTPLMTVTAGETYSYAITVTDPNADPLTIDGTTLPDWLSLYDVPGMEVTTFAYGGDEGNGTYTSFNSPRGIATDNLGNVYIAENYSNKIRKITPEGDVTTLAGSGAEGDVDGNGASASFYHPIALAVDASGNVYVADWGNKKVRKIAPNGDVTTLAGSGLVGDEDGNGANASLGGMTGLAVDNTGNVYVSGSILRKIAPNGDVTTPALKDANGVSEQLSSIHIAFDHHGNLYASTGNRIKKVSVEGVITTIAGSNTLGSADGTGANASFDGPEGLATDQLGNIYVADVWNHKIRKLTPGGVVTTLAGSGSEGAIDGNGVNAELAFPIGVATDPSGNLFVADFGNNVVRKIHGIRQLSGTAPGTSGTHQVMLSADDGNGNVTEQSFSIVVIEAPTVATSAATDITANAAMLHGDVTADGGSAIIERGFVCALTSVDPTPTLQETSGEDVTKVVLEGTTGAFSSTLRDLAGSTAYSFAAYAINSVDTTHGAVSTWATEANTPVSFTSTPPLLLTVGESYVYEIETEDVDNDFVTISGLSLPDWLTLHASPGNEVTTLAGSEDEGDVDGEGASARFYWPLGMDSDASGNVYIADSQNHKVKKMDRHGRVTTIAGSGLVGNADGDSDNASFNHPSDVAVDGNGNIYVADYENHCIRLIDPEGNVSTLAGSGVAGYMNGQGIAAQFNYPGGIAIDDEGNIYVADTSNDRIRKIDSDRNVTTLAGSGDRDHQDGVGADASFVFPGAIEVSDNGMIYAISRWAIRQISKEGEVTTHAGRYEPGDIDGPGDEALFNNPQDLSLDSQGNMYVTDYDNFKIRKVSPAGAVVTVVGQSGWDNRGYTDGVGDEVRLMGPWGSTVDPNGNFYFVDGLKIRKISGKWQVAGTAPNTPGTYEIQLSAEDGNGGSASQTFELIVQGEPTVATLEASDWDLFSAMLDGEVSSDGESEITERGFVYAETSADATPTLAESVGEDVTKVVIAGGTGSFSTLIEGLNPETSYSFAAFATNTIGTAHGTTMTVTTDPLTAPTLTLNNLE